jgi:membrane protease YdiL (CAAX protease family)
LLENLPSNPSTLMLFVLPSQAFFLLAAIIPALLSTRPWRERLGLRRPAISTRTWLALALATPAVQICSGLFASLFFDLNESSSQMELLERLLTGHGGLTLVLIVLCAAVLPGFSEELFYRGLVRVGLVRRHGFALAILVPALLFSSAHLDPTPPYAMHATGVLLLGVWFGMIAWWTRSTIPAILAHITNNAFAILVANFIGEDLESIAINTPESITPALAVVTTVYGLSFVLLVAGLLRLKRERAET